MLTKLTRGNQVTIPKAIMERAGLKHKRDYFNVEYVDGVICLMPVDIEARIAKETFEKFQKAALKISKGDISADEDTAGEILRSRMKKR